MKAVNYDTDEQLLSLIRQDDEKAFIELYHRYAARIRSIAFSKVKSPEITAEIVQTIFINLWERRHSLNINSLSNYLFVAVKYQVINHLKTELLHNRHKGLYKAFIKISEEQTLEAVNFNELSEAVEHGVQRLPEKTQLVFRLNRMEGRSIPEIALMLNLSEKAIKYHITRSLKELRLYLKEYLTYFKIVYILGSMFITQMQ